MGVYTKRSALLASNRTNSSTSWSLSATTHQYLNLDFSTTADPSVDQNSGYLGILDLESCEEYCNMCHNDIPMEPLSVGSFADSLLEVSGCRC